MSLKQAVVFLVKSPQIRCLALMALAQGLSTNLLDIAWKTHLHMLHPSPGAYAVSMSTAGAEQLHVEQGGGVIAAICSNAKSQIVTTSRRGAAARTLRSRPLLLDGLPEPSALVTQLGALSKCPGCAM